MRCLYVLVVAGKVEDKTMMWRQKVWVWLKKYWKWIIFPVGIGGFIIALIMGFKPPPPPLPKINNSGEDALDRVEEANQLRDQKLDELKAKHQSRLVSLNDQQRKEFEELQDKSIEEVTTWFDGLR